MVYSAMIASFSPNMKAPQIYDAMAHAMAKLSETGNKGMHTVPLMPF
jgi:hypothetical protein